MKKVIPLAFILLFLLACAEVDEFFVDPKDVTPESINSSLFLMQDFLLRQVREDGSMTYMIRPDQVEIYPEGNNMIRQFMATHAIGESRDRGVAFQDAYRANLHFNLEMYYVEEEDIGYIQWNSVSNLGSAAFAYLALQHSEEHDTEKRKLIAFIEEMHHANGWFQPFLHPEGVERNQNFYPGQAMIALMAEYEQTGDSGILPIVISSSQFYADWFRSRPNPAFVPWQTIAHYSLYKATGDTAYLEFIFEMNDFLLQMMHTSCEPDRRYLGRFYDEDREEFGPPHASSTAVYVESLTYAYMAAREKGDTIREEKYRNAILLGCRSLLQLQYTSENSMGFDEETVSLLYGGVRKTVHDAELRIDNTQHAIIAFQRVLEVIGPGEYDLFYADAPKCR